MPKVAIEAEADTLEEAREAAKAQIPEGLEVLSETIVCYGFENVFGCDNTLEQALAAARSKVPAGTQLVQEILNDCRREVVTLRARDEADARERFALEHLKKEDKWDFSAGNIRIVGIRLVEPPRKKFWGLIGGQPGLYELEILRRATVVIRYQAGKPKVRLVARKSVPAVMRDILLEAQKEYDEQKEAGALLGTLDGIEMLRLIDALRAMVNSDFSESAIASAKRQSGSLFVRKYVEQFISEVK